MENEGLCPYCGKPMQQGFIRSRDRLYWEKDNGYFTPLSEGPQFLKPEVPEAWACLECGKVVIDLPRPLMGETDT